MDLREDIFDLLEIKPNDEFLITSPFAEKNERDYKCRLNKSMVVEYDDGLGQWHPNWTILPRLLTGEATIKKIIIPTNQEQLAIDYAKACGCQWIAKEWDNSIYAFTMKPIRTHREWLAHMSDDNVIKLHVPISFIHWEDDEPYYIGDKN